jgi:hypothetical protein
MNKPTTHSMCDIQLHPSVFYGMFWDDNIDSLEKIVIVITHAYRAVEGWMCDKITPRPNATMHSKSMVLKNSVNSVIYMEWIVCTEFKLVILAHTWAMLNLDKRNYIMPSMLTSYHLFTTDLFHISSCTKWNSFKTLMFNRRKNTKHPVEQIQMVNYGT